MTAITSNIDRNVVPRWRSFDDTILFGEFVPTRSRLPLEKRAENELARAEEDWRANQTEAFAAEFTGVSVVHGEPSRAREAAEFLRHRAVRPSLQSIGAKALRPTGSVELPLGSTVSDLAIAATRQHVHRLKGRLTSDPRNPIAWVEMARYYFQLGHRDQAQKALEIAIALAPRSRFVLRSSACFFVETGQLDRAHSLFLNLGKSSMDDPWIVAAEIATAEQAGQHSALARRGKRLSDDADLPPFHLAELQSQLATLELRSGSDSRARKLFRRSLADPTDNSIAQVEWAAERSAGVALPANTLSTPAAAEARTRHAVHAGDWDTAVDSSMAWLRDQPFSVAAAVVGSYSAATGLRDWERAILIAEHGLRSHPHDATLLNNLAYSQIEKGDLASGEAMLSMAAAAHMESGQRSAFLATEGLLKFRQGDPEGGRSGYLAAIEVARRGGDRRAQTMASIMLAREEILSLPGAEVEVLLTRARELAATIDDPGIAGWLADVLGAAKERNLVR